MRTLKATWVVLALALGLGWSTAEAAPVSLAGALSGASQAVGQAWPDAAMAPQDPAMDIAARLSNVSLDAPSALAVPAYAYSPTLIAPPGRLPEPATWATMIVGFASAGAALRRGRDGGHTYRLREIDEAGREAWEDFPAPDDASAVERAAEVAAGEIVELWRDTVLLKRWTAAGPLTATG